jgi:hypothetical protein
MMEKQVMMKKQMEMFQMKQNMMKQAQVHFTILFCNFNFKYVTNLQMTILKMIKIFTSNIIFLGSSELCHVWTTQQLDGKCFLQFINLLIFI